MTYYPTNCYPGVYWGSSRQVESLFPAVAAQPQFQELASDNYAFAGNREIVRIRSEERRQLRLSGLDALELEQWRQFFVEHAAVGSQCEVLVDRFTGKVLTFDGTVVDQNGEVASSFAPLSYQTVSGKLGALCLGGAVATFPNNTSSVNASLIASEGVIVCTAVCSFQSESTVSRAFWQWGAGGGGGLPTIRFFAPASYDGTRVQAQWIPTSDVGGTRQLNMTTVSWGPGAIVTTIFRWTLGNTMDVWVYVNGKQAEQKALSIRSVSLTGISSHVSVGAGDANSYPMASGVLLLFATYKKAFDDPTVLASYFPLGRNYFPQAELIEKAFMPKRAASAADVWDITWTFRNGTTTW